ncbi:RluA family pseudouridine synthase [Eggerthellaceae bacterium 3-80]|nr:RluA family pseudouridine synthase [bacterium D16-34]
MSRLLSYTATDQDQAIRLDSLLADKGFYTSRSASAKAIDEGLVFVNGAIKPKKYQVAPGDLIVYEVSDSERVQSVSGEHIPLDIRYEDNDLIVLSKQKGLVCHPSADHESGTLVNALIYHCGADHLCNVQGEDDRLGIVHRLDQDTTGLMLAAKSDTAGLLLMEAIKDRVVDRRYLALVHGIISQDTGMIDAPIARAEKDRTKMAVRDCASSREAITTFRVLERFEAGAHDDGYTLIDCKLFTGRTHQIRVHMEFTKHPLVGEQVYTSSMPRAQSAQLGLDRQFLHSFMLTFDHPLTGETMHFVDGLPTDLSQVLESLASRSMGKTAAGEEIFSSLRS